MDNIRIRLLCAVAIVGLIAAVPFFFSSNESALAPVGGGADTLVILTPHSESLKFELEQAFRRHYKAKTGRDVKIDYRAPGGTSDIVKYIADRYEAEFRYWRESKHDGSEWSREIAAAFCNPAVDTDKNASAEAKKARAEFLASDVGIGVDIFAGGGVYEHAKNAARGYAVDAGVAKRHPEYFSDDVIPFSFGGDKLYDKGGRFYGMVLSSFGICYNTDRLKEMSDSTPPLRWSDLGEPRFFNSTVVADPTKSGSANKCFEIILQECMQKAVPASEKGTAEQLDKGWADGVNLIKRIIANTRSITDSAGKVTRDVASGSAAAGMAIDFYGLSEQEWNSLQFGGEPHIVYVPPQGGTAVSADPLQLLRGAPNRQAAVEFIDFCLSPDGQKLFGFKVGTPGGPVKYALRRPPIRKDLYSDEFRQFRADPNYNPYSAGSSFSYRPEFTGRYFGLIRVLIKCIALDTNDELRAAWVAIIRAGGPSAVPEAMAEFNRIPFEYHDIAAAAASVQTGSERTPLDVAKVLRRWSDSAKESYLRAAKLAGEGK